MGPRTIQAPIVKLAVCCSLCLCGITPAVAGSISGRVIDSGGSGIRWVGVDVYDAVGPYTSGETDSDGYYTVDGLAAGSYKVFFWGSGEGYANEWYDDKAAIEDADSLSVGTASHIPDIDAVLLRANGSVSGRVTDPLGGGIADVWVDIYDSGQNLLLYTLTGTDGYYSLSGLPTGEYRIEFWESGDVYLSEWYSDKAGFAAADSVTVTDPLNTANIDAELAPHCGDGAVVAGEECDDGGTADGDCCSANCTYEQPGSSCDDGFFCNGFEICNGSGTCIDGTPPDCDDGVSCTVDSCDEAADACVNSPEDSLCENGLYCDGVEICHAVLGCQAGGDPCGEGGTCDDATDSCEVESVCGNGVVELDEQCDDGNTLGGDCCSASCRFEPQDSSCDDGLFCNGTDTCDGAGDCVPGEAPDCSDGIGCTEDSCDEAADTCVHSASDPICDDGQFCTGVETCDAVLDCQPGTPVECDDGVSCTVDSCDEEADACVNSPEDSLCDNGLYCDGTELCDAVLGCQAGSPVDCSDRAGLIALPRTGQATPFHSGDDGELRAGAPWPSSRFADNGDGTITDHLTGLVWLKDANCANTIGHDPEGTGDGSMNWESGLDFVAGINDATHDISSCSSYTAVHTDWRLSNINEIESLVHSGLPDQAAWLKGQGFINVQSSLYWSSTTAEKIWNLWALDMGVGGIESSPKESHDHVWPVRGGQHGAPDPGFPANIWKTGQTSSYYPGDDGDLQQGVSWPSPRFTDYGDGTVRDNLTGLMWLKDTDCLGAAGWEAALGTISQFNANPGGYGCGEYAAAHSDWRLPNRRELLSLTDRSQSLPVLPSGSPFTGLSPDPSGCWSSTSHAGSIDSAWESSLWEGGMYSRLKSEAEGVFVWPVRGGETDNSDQVWAGAVAMGDDWYWFDWFGYFNLLFEPWVFHMEHGFLYPFGTSTDSLVFWDSAMEDYWWTSDIQYPYVYRFSDGEWLWYQEGSSGPRWFNKLSDGSWESW